MLGGVFLGDRTVAVREFPDPEPGPGEVLVAVRASGMCGTDLRYYRGAPGASANSGEFVGGHEPAGEVKSVGPGVPEAAARVGDRVMVHHYVGCSVCNSCRSGWSQMCLTAPPKVFGTHAHGAHAPMMAVPSSTLVPLDERLSFAAGAAIGCGTGTAWGGLDRLGDIGGSTVVVLGQGPVGLSATLLARARGAEVIAVDVEPARLTRASELGAKATVEASCTDVVSAVRDLTDGGAELVLDTSGSSRAVSDGLASMRPWGRMCIVGLGGEVRFDTLGYYRRQISLSMSWSMSIVQQRLCAEFIAGHSLPIDSIFSHFWPLAQLAEAYQEFDRQSAGKGVIVFDGAQE